MIEKDSQDVCFDQLCKRFDKNVYATGKGRVRLELTMADMLTALPGLQQGKQLQILDAGAGMGQIAIWLAGLGHRVTMADISDEMLAKARQQIEAFGVSENISLMQASIQSLPELLPKGQYDLILLHGVIAWLEKPLEAIGCLLPLLKPSGRMSVLYFNRDKLILKWGITGQIASAGSGRGSKKGSLTPINPLSYAEVAEYCANKGLRVFSKSGIRVFYRFFLRFPEKFNCSIEDFISLELQYCRIEPYASLGEHTHLILGLNDR